MQALVRSLCKFAREGNQFLAADILDEGADCAQFDGSLWTPLHYAADRGRIQVMKLFLKKNPDVDLKDYVPQPLVAFFYCASRMGTVH